MDSSEYKIANPDPLRDSAKNIVNEINTNQTEDFERICSVYVDSDLKVCFQTTSSVTYNVYMLLIRHCSRKAT